MREVGVPYKFIIKKLGLTTEEVETLEELGEAQAEAVATEEAGPGPETEEAPQE